MVYEFYFNKAVKKSVLFCSMKPSSLYDKLYVHPS